MVATGSSEGEAGTQWAALAGVTAALAMFGAAQGLSSPLFTLLMQKQGMSPGLIGLSAAMMPLGLILSASFVPAAVRLVGARNLAVGCSLIGALCFLAIGYLQNWVAWYVIRFIVGVVINPLYILGEVWALSLAPPSRRGRVMGVFNTLMGAGYAAGPFTLTFIGTSGWAPFSVGVGGFLLCAVILRLVSSKLTGFEDDGQPAGSFIGFEHALAPALLLAVLVSAAVQQSTMRWSRSSVPARLCRRPCSPRPACLPAHLRGPCSAAGQGHGSRSMILGWRRRSTTVRRPALLPLLIDTPRSGRRCRSVSSRARPAGFDALGPERLASTGRDDPGFDRQRRRPLIGIVGPQVAGLLMQGIGPLGLPVVIIGLDALLVIFALYRSSVRRSGKA